MVETRNPKRLLIAAPFTPRLDGRDGGSRAMAQLLSALVGHHEIGLLYLRATDEPEIDPLLAARCAWTEAVCHRAGHGASLARASRRARLLLGLLRGRPTWVTRSAVADYAHRLRCVVREWAPSVVQLEFHIMGQYLDALEDCPAPRVLVQYEPGVSAARDRWSRALGLGRLAARWDLRAWERFEPGVLRRVQAVVVFTERDRVAVAALAPGTPVTRIPLGTLIPAKPLDPVGGEPPTLLFVGNYVHPPNVDAAVRLATAIFPAVLEYCPGTQLTLVGPNPPASVRRLANTQVLVTGEVPDVTPYLDRAAVVVVPLRMGGGMRIKVLEALAAGKAVVASPLAAEGLAIRNGEELVVASTENEFAEAIARLLNAASERVALATRARSWALSNLGWDTAVRAYETLYDGLLPSTA